MILCILLTSFAYSQTSREKEETRPNIIIFLADDAGFNDVGYHGSEIKTPNIDRLAMGGLTLDQNYVYPVCSPTRAALMTGRPPSRFGIYGALGPFTTFRFAEGTQMLPSVLKGAGYETSLVGKWHLGMEPDQIPNSFGFDHSYGYLGPWVDSYTHMLGNSNGDGSGIRQWHRDGKLIQEPGHVTDLITKEAVEFITEKRDKSKPFFLYVAYSAPHTPNQEPKKYTELYEDVIDNHSRLFFAAAMTHLDESMGEIVRSLEEEGIEENTLVIFMSDNGGASGGDYSWLIPPDEYNMTYKLADQLGDNSPLRDWKGSLYEGGIRVPAFVSWPGHFAREIIKTRVHVCDWLPTLTSLAGAEVPAGMHAEGTDVMPILQGDSSEAERVLYWGSSRQQAVRKGPWKLVRSRSGTDPDEGTYELFNLEQDPSEKEDLADLHPEILGSLKAEIQKNMELDDVNRG